MITRRSVLKAFGFFPLLGFPFKNLWFLPPPDVLLEDRSAEFVEAAYRSHVGEVARNGMLLFAYQNVRVETDARNGMLRHPLDAVYRLPTTLEDLQTMVAWARELDTRPWKHEAWDCDDRAERLTSNIKYYLNSNALGTVIDYHAAHVFNIAMLADGTVYLVEPEDIPPSIYPLERQKYPMLTGAFWH